MWLLSQLSLSCKDTLINKESHGSQVLNARNTCDLGWQFEWKSSSHNNPATLQLTVSIRSKKSRIKNATIFGCSLSLGSL